MESRRRKVDSIVKKENEMATDHERRGHRDLKVFQQDVGKMPGTVMSMPEKFMLRSQRRE